MFRHTGQSRTFKHNLEIASLLSFVAGMVNVIGFFSIQRLTTNVTGHLAFLVEEMLRGNYLQSLAFLLYIVSFFLGSFVSSLTVEIISRKNEKYVYIIPVIFEIVILTTTALLGPFLESLHPDILAFSLLFAMGLQNSLVTSISNAVVRTTHLTGLFTDMGIEVSQLFFYKEAAQRTKLKSSIRLRLTIICFFFLGCAMSGLCWAAFEIYVLLMPALILTLGLIYDSLRIRWPLSGKV